MLRGLDIVFWCMKLKRIIDQEETEQKVAWDTACSWKSSTVGKSNYASMLFWRKGKQCGIFLEFPFPLFPRLFILSSEFPEETEATRGCSFFPYPIVIIIYEKNLGCPVQRTLRTDTRVSCSSSP